LRAASKTTAVLVVIIIILLGIIIYQNYNTIINTITHRNTSQAATNTYTPQQSSPAETNTISQPMTTTTQNTYSPPSQTQAQTPVTVQVIKVIKCAGIKIPAGGTGNTTDYSIIYPFKGYTGYLIEVHVANRGSETYKIYYRLITNTGEQIDMNTYVNMGEYSPGSQFNEIPPELFNKFILITQDMHLYGYDWTTLAVSPGASENVYLFYSVPAGETPSILHVILKSLSSNNIIEFNVKIPNT